MHCARITGVDEGEPGGHHLVSGRDWGLRFGVSWSHVQGLCHQQCRLFVNSTEARPVICGKTTVDRFMTSTRKKVASRAILMPMLFFLGQHNALRAVQVRNSFSRIWTMCTSSVHERGCQPSTPSCRKSCGNTPGYESIMGRRKCGTGLATAPSLATFWTEQLAHWIQSSPQCGEEENQRTKAL